MKPTVRLRLYVCGNSVRSERAVRKIRGLGIESHGSGCEIEIVDALERPDLAERDRVIATPTLIRILPQPEVRIVGDLDGKDRILESLELSLATARPGTSRDDDNE